MTCRPFGALAAKRMPRLCTENAYADGKRVPAGACYSRAPARDASACPFAQHFMLGMPGSHRPGARHVSNSIHAEPSEDPDSTPPLCGGICPVTPFFLNEGVSVPRRVLPHEHRTMLEMLVQIDSSCAPIMGAGSTPSARGLNDLHANFGQFISHGQ